jgi:hypothetical protein
MAKILISLVGDQTAPNLFIIRDERFRDIDRYIFVTTVEMEERRRLDHLLAAAGIPPERYVRALVTADDMQAIFREMDALRLDPADEYFLNLTSGTKIMSVGLFAYFTQGHFNVRIFYVPVRKNAYRQIYPETGAEERALSYRIGLEEYLTSYGIRIEPEGAESRLRIPPAFTLQVFGHFLDEDRLFTNRQQPFRYFANALRDRFNRAQGEFIDWADIPGLGDFLAEIGFPFSRAGCLDAREARFLTGGWLEEWVSDNIRSRLNLNDEAVGVSVRIQPSSLPGKFGKNEFDVMFIYRNALYVVECKTGLGKGYREVKSVFEQSLYRLAALRADFGMNVHTCLLTLSDSLRDRRKGALRDTFAHRARLLNITLIDRKEILRGDGWVDLLI